MIRVGRNKVAPDALQKQRRAGLARAFAALNSKGVGSKELKDALTGYDGGKEILFKKQHRKCAFCERKPGLKGNPVDHFRPKTAVTRHVPGATAGPQATGYWWLTWTWTNQLFACTSCNSGYKQTWFPLAAGSALLAGPQAPYQRKFLRREHEDVSVEAALLVDPVADDPLDHIEWRLVNPAQPRRLWKWYPHPLTPKGDATIKVLGLTALAAEIYDHVRDNLLARTDAICECIDRGDHAAAKSHWLRLGQDVADSRCLYAGATWNALHLLVDTARRQTAGLPDLPRPGASP